MKCNPCDLRTIVKVKEECNETVEVDIPCCERYLFDWIKKDTRDNFVFDEFCTWDDKLQWKDDAFFYECCKFEVSTTCIPTILDGPGWYDTNDVLAYVMGNGFLYGVTEPEL